MRLVLFGAGASYGCGDVSPRPPPLGGQLFAALSRLYASWRGVPADVAVLFRKNFESGMAALIERHSHAIAPLMQDMAIFFSMFGFARDASNLYTRIVKAETGGNILWATLNYECLLELAVASVGNKIGYFQDPPLTQGEVPVWKLHGSCNFKVSGLEATRGISFSSGISFGAGIEPIELSAVRTHYKGNTALYPAMALFAKGKPIAMSPDPVQWAQRRWAEHVSVATRTLVIGVHPNKDDEHIWGPLRRAPGALGYVGDPKAFNDWRATAVQPSASICLGSRWAECESAALKFLSG
jgi:hypothetical protein